MNVKQRYTEEFKLEAIKQVSWTKKWVLFTCLELVDAFERTKAKYILK